jgi:hypothetical protein
VLCALAFGGGLVALRRWHRGRLPRFDVARSECDRRATRTGPLLSITTWRAGDGPAGTGATIESNGRWLRRTAFPSSQFTPPDEYTHGCLAPADVAPLFADFARLLVSPGVSAQPSAYGPDPERAGAAGRACVSGYTDAHGGATGLPWGTCAFTDLAERVMRRVPERVPEVFVPAPCTAAQCEIELIVGHVPHPHEGSGATRSARLFADGTFACDTDHFGDPLRGRVTPGGDVFAWLTRDARSPAEPLSTETMAPLQAALIYDRNRAPVASLSFATARERWNQIAARLAPVCRR